MISLTDEEGERTYTYDRRGNLTAVSRGEELLKLFTFDAANRMSSAIQIKEGVEKRAEYHYNAFGNRTGQDIYSSEIGSDNRWGQCGNCSLYAITNEGSFANE